MTRPVTNGTFCPAVNVPGWPDIVRMRGIDKSVDLLDVSSAFRLSPRMLPLKIPKEPPVLDKTDVRRSVLIPPATGLPEGSPAAKEKSKPSEAVVSKMTDSTRTCVLGTSTEGKNAASSLCCDADAVTARIFAPSKG